MNIMIATMTMMPPAIAMLVVLFLFIAVSIQHCFGEMCCFVLLRCIIRSNGAYGVMVSTWACGAHSEGSNPSRHPLYLPTCYSCLCIYCTCICDFCCAVCCCGDDKNIFHGLAHYHKALTKLCFDV